MSTVDPLLSAIAGACDRRDLSEEEAAAALGTIMGGHATGAQIGALLGALRAKGETVDEVVGAARAMRERMDKVASRRAPLVDTCGTGGDQGGTFSISTTAAMVAAGAGASVAKAGNRAASGRFGSADVLEALGVAIDLPADAAGRCLDRVGISFLFARRLHPAMRHVAAARSEMGVRTIFNLLGPLTNPAGATRQVVGVASREAFGRVAAALARLGTEHALVVRSRDGLDEIALTAPIDAVEVRSGEVVDRVFDAADFGLARIDREALAAPDLAASVRILHAVLAGEPGPCADVVVANAAAALYVAGVAPGLREGVARAREAIASGAAKRALDDLVACSRQEAAAVGGGEGRARV
ncbi:anthranilate phosphoribosyltransferase [bacterium]|nr:anthranilate phosphoribosyltransferase [bacterium]